jgi:hypothetical protein
MNKRGWQYVHVVDGKPRRRKIGKRTYLDSPIPPNAIASGFLVYASDHVMVIAFPKNPADFEKAVRG